MIVITGNPGVGKHTVAELLSDELQYEIFDINKIAIDEGIIEKKSETSDVDVNKMHGFLQDKISNESILVGHLAPYVIDSKYVSAVIVLRKHPDKLEEIYQQRNYSKKKTQDNIQSEVLGIIAFDAEKEFGREKMFHIDTSKISPSQVVNKIKKIISGEFQDERIDWLDIITQENELERIFPD